MPEAVLSGVGTGQRYASPVGREPPSLRWLLAEIARRFRAHPPQGFRQGAIDMRIHQFAIGERVAYTEQQFPDFVWRGDYEIVSLVGPGSDEPEYRIRSADRAYDRVVRERDLSRWPALIDLRSRP